MREIPLGELEPQTRSTLEKAQRAMKESYFHYARTMFVNLLERYPNCPQLRLLARQANVAANDKPVWSVWAKLKTVLVELMYATRHFPFHHINSLEFILLQAPDCLWAHKAFVRVALSKGMYQTAALSLEAISTLQPENTHAQVQLSECYVKIGRIDEAQEVIRNILAKAPQNDFAQELLKEISVQQSLKSSQWTR